MKRKGIGTAILGVVALVASTAYAGWGDAATIAELEVIPGDGAYKVWVSGVTNNSTNDPNNCQTTGGTIGSYRLQTSGTTAEGRELMARSLLSAFLAGRQVKFELDPGACSGTSPLYRQVSVLP